MTPLRAAPVVAAAIAGYRAQVEAETLRLFRLDLQASVRRASPLALAIARSEGIDVVARLEGLRPGAGWLAGRGRPERPTLFARPAGTAGRRRRPAPLGIWDFERSEGPLDLDVAGGALRIMGRLGPCSVFTTGRNAWLSLPSGVPDTVLSAMRGRDVDALVGHPAFAGRGYVVRDVVPDTMRGGAALLFGTGLVTFEMPWGDMLRAEMARARS